uniref:Uncharacterized protein n=1 Tax=Arundo donax TaxID=35708 RepID=A0A0A9HZN1_ARUDO
MDQLCNAIFCYLDLGCRLFFFFV